MAPKKRRRMGVSGFLNPLDGLAEQWDAVASVDEAKLLFAELSAAGFDPSEELRLAGGRKPTDIYRRLFFGV